MLLKNEFHRNTVRRSLTLPEEIVRDIDLYAKAIDSSPNWVVSQILAKFFAKDKDFLEWKDTHRDSLGKIQPPKPISSGKPAKETGASPVSS